jgi:hypothetical protein
LTGSRASQCNGIIWSDRALRYILLVHLQNVLGRKLLDPILAIVLNEPRMIARNSRVFQHNIITRVSPNCDNGAVKRKNIASLLP